MGVNTLQGLNLRCALSETKALQAADVTTTVGAGDMDKLNDLVGVYATSLENSKSTYVAFIYYAPKILLPCEAAATGDYAVGDKVYYDASANRLTFDSTGNTVCGVVLEAAEVGDTTVLVSLDAEIGL